MEKQVEEPPFGSNDVKENEGEKMRRLLPFTASLTCKGRGGKPQVKLLFKPRFIYHARQVFHDWSMQRFS